MNKNETKTRAIDIDIDTLLEENVGVDDYFYLQDLKQRKLFLISL